MRQALLAKFSQHRRLREQLLATGSATLVERTQRNASAVWGNGGHNRLGPLLMQLRDQLRQEDLTHGKPPEL